MNEDEELPPEDDDAEFDAAFEHYAEGGAALDADEEIPVPKADEEDLPPLDDEPPKGDDEPPKGDDEGEPELKNEGEPEKKVDIWENVPDTIRQAHDAALQRADQADQKYRSNEGRFKARERQAARDLQEIAALKAAGSTEVKDKEGDTDDFKTIREDYPEIVEPLEIALKRKDAKIEALSGEVNTLKGISHEEAISRENEALTARNPNWTKSITHEGFTDWVDHQPQYVRDIVSRNYKGIVDSEESFDIIEKFEQAVGISYEADAKEAEGNDAEAETVKLADKRKLQAEAANAPTSKSRGSAASGPADDFDKAFDYYAKKADKKNSASA